MSLPPFRIPADPCQPLLTYPEPHRPDEALLFGASPKTILVKFLVRLWLTVRHRLLGRRYRRLVVENVEGVPFIVLPEVFNPVLFRTGAFLAQTLSKIRSVGPEGMPHEKERGEGKFSALDLGTGSGVAAVFAARAGASVVAVDV